MANNDTFRALASIVINETIDEDLKKKAKGIMSKIMDAMDREADIDISQLKKFSANLSGIETIQGYEKG